MVPSEYFRLQILQLLNFGDSSLPIDTFLTGLSPHGAHDVMNFVVSLTFEISASYIDVLRLYRPGVRV